MEVHKDHLNNNNNHLYHHVVNYNLNQDKGMVEEMMDITKRKLNIDLLNLNNHNREVILNNHKEVEAVEQEEECKLSSDQIHQRSEL